MNQKARFRNFVGTARQKRKGKQEIVYLPDPNNVEIISYELFFRSVVPLLVNRCQGNCGDKLFPADKEDYVVVKSRVHISAYPFQGRMLLRTRTAYT